MSTPLPELSLIDALTLQRWLDDGQEIALLDIREEGLFGEGHALLAANLPYSRLELDIARAVPRLTARIVLIAEDATLPLAVARLAALGYRNVHALTGGTDAWRAAGNDLFPSIHVPSKAFAEVVEHAFHTPSIEADELARLQQSGANLVVLDSRTTEEYTRFHVPGAISVPSAELVYRFDDLVPSPATLVVISCAGRTRGIIGAQALINARVPNRVVALAGGTQGWRLAGLPVEKGRTRTFGPVSDAASRSARNRAQALARRFSVESIDVATLATWQSESDRTTYLFDVRQSEEYEAGHLPGAVSVAGGQLVQTLDKWAATRGARIVLADDAAVRSVVTAHWLKQLGWHVVVLPFTQTDVESPAAGPRAGSLPELDTQHIEPIPARTASAWIAQGAAAISVASSANFRDRHPAGAIWTNRARIAHLPVSVLLAPRVVVFADQKGQGLLAAYDLAERTGKPVALVEGGLDAWQAAGLPVESSPEHPADAKRIDHLFWLYDRHLGNAQASRAYLDWELSLPAAIGSPEKAGFRLAPKAAAV